MSVAFVNHASQERNIEVAATTSLDTTGPVSALLIFQVQDFSASLNKFLLEWSSSSSTGVGIAMDGAAGDGGLLFIKRGRFTWDSTFNLALNTWYALGAVFYDGIEPDVEFWIWDYSNAVVTGTRTGVNVLNATTSAHLRLFSSGVVNSGTTPAWIDSCAFIHGTISRADFMNWALRRPVSQDFILNSQFPEDTDTTYRDLAGKGLVFVDNSSAQSIGQFNAPVATLHRGWSQYGEEGGVAAPVGIAQQLTLLGVG